MRLKKYMGADAHGVYATAGHTHLACSVRRKTTESWCWLVGPKGALDGQKTNCGLKVWPAPLLRFFGYFGIRIENFRETNIEKIV